MIKDKMLKQIEKEFPSDEEDTKLLRDTLALRVYDICLFKVRKDLPSVKQGMKDLGYKEALEDVQKEIERRIEQEDVYFQHCDTDAEYFSRAGAKRVLKDLLTFLKTEEMK